MISGNYKYLFYSGRDELYDLKNDPLEGSNISSLNEYLTLFLKQKLFQILHDNIDLRKRLNVISSGKNKYTGKEKKELRTLGYL